MKTTIDTTTRPVRLVFENDGTPSVPWRVSAWVDGVEVGVPEDAPTLERLFQSTVETLEQDSTALLVLVPFPDDAGLQSVLATMSGIWGTESVPDWRSNEILSAQLSLVLEMHGLAIAVPADEDPSADVFSDTMERLHTWLRTQAWKKAPLSRDHEYQPPAPGLTGADGEELDPSVCGECGTDCR